MSTELKKFPEIYYTKVYDKFGTLLGKIAVDSFFSSNKENTYAIEYTPILTFKLST